MKHTDRQYINEFGNLLPFSGNPKIFNMIDNYIYLYHTDTMVIIPTFPENMQDTMTVNYTPNSVLSRSAPIYAYSSSGPRAMTFQILLQREMMDIINTTTPLGRAVDLQGNSDYTEFIIRNLQAMAVPRYSASEKMVDPPLVAVRFGSDIFIKGVVSGSVTVGYEGPILGTSADGSITKYDNKYSRVNISFTVNEVNPYGADEIIQQGSFRGLQPDLERRVYIGG